MASSVHDFEVKKIDGSPTKLSEYKGKTLLIVNVASQCGLTPQYGELGELYQRFNNLGLEILAFPANEFLSQEPGSNEEIQEFCETNYGVQFPMFEKIVVKGKGQNPLYNYLTSEITVGQSHPDSKFQEKLKSKGLLNGEEGDITWNFEKFLVNAEGQVVARFSPDLLPQDPLLVQAIEKELSS